MPDGRAGPIALGLRPMTTFFTADSHFGDAHILRYRGSHFADIEAHDEALVARWNAAVGPEDDLWHLGDFAAGASRERCGALFERLHGRKRLVCGNHDTRRVLDLPWLAVVDHARITIEEDGVSWRLFLAHYAHRAWPGLWRGTRHLYGHTHGTLPDTTLSCDVGVDAWDYRPMTLAAVAARQDGATLLPEELARDRASARDRAARPGAVAAAPPQSDATC